MKVSVAQIKPYIGDIRKNIEIHKEWIEIAVSKSADLIVFPELSLTGYTRKLANELATDQNDPRLSEFQKFSDQNKISIGLGLPIRSTVGTHIGMVFFQPNRIKTLYLKQKLHSDELPYFIEGNEQLMLKIKGEKIAPAICYESLQEEHAIYAKKLGANIYMASVAKPQTQIEKAFEYFPKVAKKFSMPVFMSNSIGPCDDFISAGQTAIWNKDGELIEKLKTSSEGLLTLDTRTNRVNKI